MAIWVFPDPVFSWSPFGNPPEFLAGHHANGRNDLTDYFLPPRVSAVLRARGEGTWPMWDSSLFGGLPWWANPQTGWLYPPYWPGIWTGTITATSVLLVLHHIFGGLGVWWVSRRFGAGFAASILGGTTFLAAPYLIAHTAEGHLNHICVIAWYPWIFLAGERIREGRRYRFLAAVASITLAFFAGHVQELYYLLVAMTGSMAWTTFGPAIRSRLLSRGESDTQSSNPERINWRPLREWITVGVLVAGLTAPILLPTLHNSLHSMRGGGLSARAAGAWGLNLSSLQQLIDPFALGGPQAMTREHAYYWEILCYFGIVPLVIGLVSLVELVRCRVVRGWCLQVAFWFAFAFGTGSGVFWVVHNAVPGFQLFRMPGRTLFVVNFFFALLVARGSQVFIGSVGERLGRGVVLVPILLWVAMVGEFGWFAGRMLRTIPVSDYRTSSELTRELSGRLSGRRVFTTQKFLSDYESRIHGFPKLLGYEPLAPASTRLLIDGLTTDEKHRIDYVGFVEPNWETIDSRMLDLFAVAYVVHSPDATIDRKRWPIVKTGAIPPRIRVPEAPESIPYVLRVNPSALPRAYVIGRVAIDSEVTVSDLRDVNPRDAVLLAEDVWPETTARESFHPARIEQFGSNRLTVTARTTSSGYLVLCDTFADGWTASVNGRPAPILLANGLFRAVPLPPGDHRIEFTYRPPWLLPGLTLCGLTVSIWIGSTVWRRRRAGLRNGPTTQIEP